MQRDDVGIRSERLRRRTALLDELTTMRAEVRQATDRLSALETALDVCEGDEAQTTALRSAMKRARAVAQVRRIVVLRIAETIAELEARISKSQTCANIEVAGK